MTFEGAIIKEQGVTFAIIVVKKYAISSDSERKAAIETFSSIFPDMPIILMAQDSKGIPTYYGRKDIVNFLSKISVSRIPWKKFTIN